MSTPASLLTSPGLRFYREVCRCVPFLITQFQLDEVTNKHNLRRAVASRFERYKDMGNPEAVELLIMKGRQELEEVMERFKTRSHVVNEWVYNQEEAKRAAAAKPNLGYSPFLEAFLQGNYSKPEVC